MRIKIESHIFAVNDAHIFDEDPNVVFCNTVEDGVFRLEYLSKELAERALNKLFCFGYLEVNENECECSHGIFDCDWNEEA